MGKRIVDRDKKCETKMASFIQLRRRKMKKVNQRFSSFHLFNCGDEK